MCTKNRIRLAVLVLLLGPLVLGSPAAGKKWSYDWIPASNANCRLAPTGVEPEASGRAKLSDAFILWPDVSYVNGNLSVIAQGLTPGEWYYVYPCVTWDDWGTPWPAGGRADDDGVLDPGPLRVMWHLSGLSSTVEIPVTVANENNESVLEGTLVVNVQL